MPKPEPLQGKKRKSVIGSNDLRYWSSEDIASACAWLKQKLTKDGEYEYGIQSPDFTLRELFDLIDIAFQDVIGK